MPPKKRFEGLSVPGWVDAFEAEDECLHAVLIEALVARHSAVLKGAERFDACKSALASADATLDAIHYGRIKGVQAWRKAAVAVRKYNTAHECVSPTADRFSRRATRRDRPRRRKRRSRR